MQIQVGDEVSTAAGAKHLEELACILDEVDTGIGEYITILQRASKKLRKLNPQ